jgi:hypothetical protein
MLQFDQSDPVGLIAFSEKQAKIRALANPPPRSRHANQTNLGTLSRPHFLYRLQAFGFSRLIALQL